MVRCEGTGTSFNADFWRITNIDIWTCGDLSSNGDESRGAGVYVWTDNANGGVGTAIHTLGCNVGIYDKTYFATWIGCYSESGQLGFNERSTLGSTFIHCSSEDVTHSSFQSGLTINGTLTQSGPQGAPHRIGFGVSQLQFGTISTAEGRIPLSSL
jgi:hypothetical protein